MSGLFLFIFALKSEHVKNITVEQYFALEDPQPYIAVLKHLHPSSFFAGTQFNLSNLSYLEVRTCLKLMKTGKTPQDICTLFCTAFKIEPFEFWDESVKRYFAALNYLVKAFHDLQQREARLLTSIDADTALWELAGGEKLNKFGDLMPLVQLGEIYGMWPYELQHKPYNDILTLLVLHKERGEVQKKYNELKTKKR